MLDNSTTGNDVDDDDNVVQEEEQMQENQTSYPVQQRHRDGNRYGQLSRSMDKVLFNGRQNNRVASTRQQPVSILISLLFLGVVVCGSLGFVSLSIGWYFARTTTGHKVCSVPQDICTEQERYSDMKQTIDGIPEELQKWAHEIRIRRRRRWRSVRDVVQMVDSTVFFVGEQQDSTENRTSLFLSSIEPDGSMEDHPEFQNPTYFTSVNGKDPLSSELLCCIYDEATVVGSYVPRRSILCIPTLSSGKSTSLTFLTVSIPAISDTGVTESRTMSMIALNGTVWAKQQFDIEEEEDSDEKPVMWTEYYKIILEDSDIRIKTVTRAKQYYDTRSPPVRSSCLSWIQVIFALALIASMSSGSYWLVTQRRILAGIVPGFCVLIVVCSYISRDGTTLVTIVAMCWTLLALVRLVPIPSMLGREGCIWILYTAIILCPLVRNVRPVGIVVGAILCAGVGVVLDHPTLYLMGWIGGIGTIPVSIFFYLTHNHKTAHLCIGIGLMCGVGGVSVGLFLIKCRKYVSFWLGGIFMHMGLDRRSQSTSHNLPTDGAAVDGIEMSVDEGTDASTATDWIPEENARSLEIEFEDSSILRPPPISRILSRWLFWGKFVLFPCLFVLMNGLVLMTLLEFRVHAFQNAMDILSDEQYPDRAYPPTWFDGALPQRDSFSLEMFRYNAMVIGIVALLDCFLLYRAIRFIAKEEVAYGTMLETVGANMESASMNLVYARASKQFEDYMFRGSSPHTEPRASTLLNLLFLMLAMTAAVSCSLLAFWCLSWTSTAKIACSSGNSDDYDESKKQFERMNDMPADLQEWARRQWYDTLNDPYYDVGPIRLAHGTTYLAAVDPRIDTSSESASVPCRPQPHYQSTSLLQVQPSRTVKFLSSITSPRNFVTVVGDQLDSEIFCCIYGHISFLQPNAINALQKSARASTSLLCISSNEPVETGEFRNVTLNPPGSISQYSNVQWFMESTSTKAFEQELWIKVVWSCKRAFRYNRDRYTEFYKVDPSGERLELVPIIPIVTSRYHSLAYFYDEPLSCIRWRTHVIFIPFMAVLSFASIWLLRVKRLPVGVVPACWVGYIVLLFLNEYLSMVVCFLVIGMAWTGLHGWVPIPMPIGREYLIWILYTTLLFAAKIGAETPLEFCIIGMSSVAAVAVSLNHAAFHILGWIGGLIAACIGIVHYIQFESYDYEKATGFLLGGMVGGLGFLTVCQQLAKYQVYLSYYLNRFWKSMISMKKNRSTVFCSNRSEEAQLTENLLVRND